MTLQPGGVWTAAGYPQDRGGRAPPQETSIVGVLMRAPTRRRSTEAGEPFARRAFRYLFEETLRAVAPPDTIIERAGEGGPEEAPPVA